MVYMRGGDIGHRQSIAFSHLGKHLDLYKANGRFRSDANGNLGTEAAPSSRVADRFGSDDRQSLINDLNLRLLKTNAVYTSTLLPNALSNLQTALKALIEGFIRHHDHQKRRSTVSVATYDMQLLCSWFTWVSNRENEVPRLVALIPDLESCTANVVHDLLHISRNYCDRLPLTFILGASSADVLTTMFGRATRKILTVTKFVLPTEEHRFEMLIQRIFLDPSFTPSLIPSGRVTSWLHYSWSRFHGSLDSFISHVQLIYLRHFQNPLSILWSDNSFGLESLADRIQLGEVEEAGEFLQDLATSLDAITPSMETFLQLSGKAIDDFNTRLQTAKRSFHLLLVTQAYLRELSQQNHASELGISFIKLVGLFGDGRLEEIYPKLLKRIQQVAFSISCHAKTTGRQISDELVDETFLAQIERFRHEVHTTEQTEEQSKQRHPIGEDIATQLRDMQTMDSWLKHPLSAVWRTADVELPIDMLNPSMRNVVLESLRHPGSYLLHDVTSTSNTTASQSSMNGQETTRRGGPVTNPDICILFARYADAGRTINVYDWFESFVQGLEAGRPQSTKSKAEFSEEGWRREAYARFMWALHEMDMLGLLRWTGRGTGKKGAECTGKVVWVTPE
ncbi:hypothetical protein PIIN_02237 [Serendipita indica DSM 11827]|uniref:Uncharacterized protein n=1 Tax=Serendipita indica (strain DSM 11827) TaxID=1109443 RepID=G4TAM0_SERID|nr:hypothetical protein PIIN_02237 [Serendipita indica DSM 11827]